MQNFLQLSDKDFYFFLLHKIDCDFWLENSVTITDLKIIVMKY